MSSKNKKNHPKIVWKPPTGTQTLKLFFKQTNIFSVDFVPPRCSHEAFSSKQVWVCACLSHAGLEKGQEKIFPQKNNSLFPPSRKVWDVFLFFPEFGQANWDPFLFLRPFLNFLECQKPGFLPIHSKTHVPTIPNPNPPQKKKDKKTSGKKSN